MSERVIPLPQIKLNPSCEDCPFNGVDHEGGILRRCFGVMAAQAIESVGSVDEATAKRLGLSASKSSPGRPLKNSSIKRLQAAIDKCEGAITAPDDLLPREPMVRVLPSTKRAPVFISSREVAIEVDPETGDWVADGAVQSEMITVPEGEGTVELPEGKTFEIVTPRHSVDAGRTVPDQFFYIDEGSDWRCYNYQFADSDNPFWHPDRAQKTHLAAKIIDIVGDPEELLTYRCKGSDDRIYTTHLTPEYADRAAHDAERARE